MRVRPAFRLGLSLHLEGCGFQVITAGSAEEAVQILERPGCSVDVVFSDVRMPGEMDGIGLSRWVFDNKPHIAVILASGDFSKSLAVGDLCGAQILTKPYDYELATNTIRAAIQHSAKQ